VVLPGPSLPMVRLNLKLPSRGGSTGGWPPLRWVHSKEAVRGLSLGAAELTLGASV
jgi:hypothetical protein